uniref:Uncharacterized protein n=1 Tax=Mycena chlorophos TaxID=658473 RepID=A0ABQ0L4Z8_MYCCL|nr:predicted protein [Mycena chlorophos]
MDLRPQPQTPASAWGYSTVTDYSGCTTAHSTTTTLDDLTDTRRDYKQPPEPRFRPAYPDYRKHRMLPVGQHRNGPVPATTSIPRQTTPTRRRLGCPRKPDPPSPSQKYTSNKILSKNPGSVHVSKSKTWFCSLAHAQQSTSGDARRTRDEPTSALGRRSLTTTTLPSSPRLRPCPSRPSYLNPRLELRPRIYYSTLTRPPTQKAGAIPPRNSYGPVRTD